MIPVWAPDPGLVGCKSRVATNRLGRSNVGSGVAGRTPVPWARSMLQFLPKAPKTANCGAALHLLKHQNLFLPRHLSQAAPNRHNTLSFTSSTSSQSKSSVVKMGFTDITSEIGLTRMFSSANCAHYCCAPALLTAPRPQSSPGSSAPAPTSLGMPFPTFPLATAARPPFPDDHHGPCC